MNEPLVLDLFAGAQGSSVGYKWAGYRVHAVDIEPHEKHPDVAWFIVADALDVLDDLAFCRRYELIHAGPPCQRYSTQTPDSTRDSHPDLIGPVRERLRRIGVPYVIENVEGARRELDNPIRLCGSSFGLGVRRHRYFEVRPDVLLTPPCQHGRERPWTVTGDHPETRDFLRPNGTRRARKPRDVEHAREVMGIDWMDWGDLTESIPPVYTQWLGEQLREHLGRAA